MLRLRLQRRGKRNYATFRVVVADQHAPIKGKFVADVGSYNPHTNAFTVKPEIVQEWLRKGVQPSATVHNLLVTHGILKADKVTIWLPKKTEEATKTPEAVKPADSDKAAASQPAAAEAPKT